PIYSMAVEKVRASYQAKAFDIILPMLDSDEEGVLKRGRNATGNTVPKSSNPIEYHKATAIESLFGYLHLIGNKPRIDEIFEIIWNIEE
ncbi:MAG: ribonuclease III domain-containing protein, partial [Oscillospiraceae bacterium]